MTDTKQQKFASMEEVSEMIESSLTDEQTDLLLEPFEDSEFSASTPLDLDSKEETGIKVRLWLHVKQKRTCWYVKARHEYEAFVTKDASNGPRYSIDKIELHIKRGKDGADYKHSCTNTSWCPKTDKLHGTFNMCGWTKVQATGTHWGQSWSTSWNSID